MPVYVLRPVGPIIDEATWYAVSRYKGFCRVHAPDEDGAREYTADFYGEPPPASRLSEGDQLWSPWLDPASTECHFAGDPPPEEYFDGQIEETVNDGPSGNDPVAIDVYKGGIGRKWRVVKEGRSGQTADLGQTGEQDETGPVSPVKSVEVGPATEDDVPLPVVAGTASSMLPPLQQHAEGPGVNEGNRGDQTLPSFRSGSEGHVDSEEVRNVDLSADIAATAGIAVEAEVIRRSEVTQRPVHVFRGRLVKAPEEIANSLRFAIAQVEQNLAYLRDRRLNSPEAAEAIEALEGHTANLQALLTGVEGGDPPDQSVERWQRMLDLLLDSVERFIASDALVRTTFLGVAVSTCAALGVSELVQAIVAVSAVGADRKILDGVRGLFKDDKAD